MNNLPLKDITKLTYKGKLSEYEANPLYLPEGYIIIHAYIMRDMGGQYPAFSNNPDSTINIDECRVVDKYSNKILVTVRGFWINVDSFSINVICVKI